MLYYEVAYGEAVVLIIIMIIAYGEAVVLHYEVAYGEAVVLHTEKQSS